MFSDKKTEPQSENDEESGKPIDFDWVYLIGIAGMGFTETQIDQMYLGRFLDFFEIYKTKRALGESALKKEKTDKKIAKLSEL